MNQNTHENISVRLHPRLLAAATKRAREHGLNLRPWIRGLIEVNTGVYVPLGKPGPKRRKTLEKQAT